MGWRSPPNPIHLLYTLIGVFIGTMISHLPGIGPSAGIALLIPVTFGMDPSTALMMLAGIYYGCMYGGAVTAILLNTPGDAAAVMTVLDGYPMARKGRAGAALAIAAVSSFIAGTMGVTALAFVAMPLAAVALHFGPAEYFSLIFFALTTVSALTGDSLAKGMMSTFIGLGLATIGIDLQTGVPRFTMGFVQLQDRVSFLVVVVGLFAIAEVTRMVEGTLQGTMHTVRVQGKLWFTREEWRRAKPAIFRGSAIGFFCGAAPGLGGTIAAMLAYVTEKKISKRPQEFGHGAIEGVAAPGGRDQCRYLRGLRPSAGAGHSRLRLDGGHHGRLHHVRHPARADALHHPSRSRLGPHRQHVYRQSDAAGAELAAGRASSPASSTSRREFCWC